MPYSFHDSSRALHAIQEQPQQSYAPATSPHQGTRFDTMGLDGSPIHDISGRGRMEVAMQPEMATDRQVKPNVAAQIPPPAENFRFRVVLHAPTAMIKSADAIPITYLNRGQVYSMSIVNTQPMLPVPVGARYRTSLRISFEEEHQRQQPASCWQLWKEGYSYTEWFQRGGKVQAVEYVEAIQQAGADDKRTYVELATASIDGFSIVWTPGTTGLAECRLRVRFNFLSTDFSHSKGVKGIPVRLCAKTVALGQSTPHAALASTKVAYCKVKLFRAHGAERKLSNDVAHVKNTIDKLKQRVALSEADMKGFGKSKRSISMSKSAATQNAGSIPKRKHALSILSASSTGGHGPFEEGLHYKLQQQQDMLTSTRPVSILHLCGVKQDDPDLHPVALPGSPSELTTVVSYETSAWQRRASMLSNSTASISSLVSPSQSPISLHSGATVHGLAAPVAAQWTDYQADLGVDLPASPQHFTNPADKLTKVPKMDDAGSCSSWIEALGVDEAYCPPPERMVKAVACFYVLYRDATPLSQKPYYRAVYLVQRTLINLLAGIGSKCGINPSTVRRSLHILSSGLEVEMDDNMVWGMPDGQDMVLEVKELSAAATTKWEREITINGVDAEGDCAWREMCDIRLLF